MPKSVRGGPPLLREVSAHGPLVRSAFLHRVRVGSERDPRETGRNLPPLPCDSPPRTRAGRLTGLRIPLLSLYSRTVVRLAQSTGLSESSQHEQFGGRNGPQSPILFADGQSGERFASGGVCVGKSHSP